MQVLPVMSLRVCSVVEKAALRGFVVILGVLAICGGSARAQAYKVTNIVSDGSVPATTTDPNFINPWAISNSGTWWISAAGTGYNYVISATTGANPFKVIVPSAANQTSPGFPAGSVTTTGASGMVLPNGTKAAFLFSTLDGTISGWNNKLGTANAICQIVINNSSAGASYPGFAILNTSPTTSYLLAANFGTGNAIEVYDNAFKPAKLAGSFTDPTLPAGYSPFAVHVLGNQVFVSYALRSANAPYVPVTGSGNGVVSIFDTSGNFVMRAITGGNLNAPWGVAFAPANFGIFSNDLLIGNFGDGIINVFDPKTFVFLGQLVDSTGKSLSYASLWELLTGGTSVGGSTAGGDTSTVYFTAGLSGEKHGLLGGITNSTTTGATPTFGFSAGVGAITVTAPVPAQFVVSVAPVNGFSGTVTLACNGMPAGANCSFSPAQVSVTPSSVATSTATILTTKSASVNRLNLRRRFGSGIAIAFLLPLISVLAARRRLGKSVNTMRWLSVGVAFFVVASLAIGCSSNYMSQASMPSTGTPTGLSNLVLTATSGSITQQTTVALTVR